MYRPITLSSGGNPKSSIISTLAPSGVNLRDYEQLLDTKFAQRIQNYLIEAGGRLRRRKGLSELFDASQINAVTLLKKYTDDIFIFAYNTTVAAYTLSTDTITTIKSDFTTSDPFDGVKYGDYFFVCNGGDKIGRISQTLDYDALLYAFSVGDVVTGGTSGATGIILEDDGTTLTLGNVVGVFQDDEAITDTGLRGVNYDGQTSNFTVGSVAQGGTSSAEGTIISDSDTGTEGQLILNNYSGTKFQDGEAITDIAGGAATVNGANGAATVNGTLGFTYTQIDDAPNAKVLFILGTRLFAGNLSGNIVGDAEGDPYTVVWAEQDLGDNPPFTNWTTAASPAATDDPSSFRYRNAGEVKSFGSIGDQVIVLYDDGKAGFRISTIDVDGSGLAQNTLIDFSKIDFGGERGTAVTPEGVFYANETGIFQMVSGGQTNVPFSEQESKISLVFGQDVIDDIGFTNADLVYDPRRNIVMCTCAQDSSTNNLILVYDLDSKAWTTFKGWNLSRFLVLNNVMYGASATASKVYTLFDGEDDDGTPIDTDYLQELNVGSFSERKALKMFYIQAQLSQSSDITVAFDIYDRQGSLVMNKEVITLQASSDAGASGGYGSTSWGTSPFGGDIETGGLTQNFSGASNRINNFQRIRIHITSSDRVSHEINLIQAQVESKGLIRRRNITT